MKYNLKTYSKKLLADTITAVSVNLSKHDNFLNSLLVENSDYHSNHYSFHYICSNPIAYITIEKEISKQKFSDVQLMAIRNRAKIHPITGTYKHIGNDEQDAI